MLRSLGLGLGPETFAKFLRVSVSVSKNLVSEKKYRFRKNLVSEKKSRFRENLVSEKSLGFGFGKFGSGKKSLGFGFGKFGLGKKVSVSVSEKLVSEKFLGFGEFGLKKKVLVLVLGNLISEKKKLKKEERH